MWMDPVLDQLARNHLRHLRTCCSSCVGTVQPAHAACASCLSIWLSLHPRVRSRGCFHLTQLIERQLAQAAWARWYLCDTGSCSMWEGAQGDAERADRGTGTIHIQHRIARTPSILARIRVRPVRARSRSRVASVHHRYICAHPGIGHGSTGRRCHPDAVSPMDARFGACQVRKAAMHSRPRDVAHRRALARAATTRHRRGTRAPGLKPGMFRRAVGKTTRGDPVIDLGSRNSMHAAARRSGVGPLAHCCSWPRRVRAASEATPLADVYSLAVGRCTW